VRSMLHPAGQRLPLESPEQSNESSPSSPSTGAAHYAWCDRTGSPMVAGGQCGALSRRC
jgi:hypothetical protein